MDEEQRSEKKITVSLRFWFNGNRERKRTLDCRCRSNNSRNKQQSFSGRFSFHFFIFCALLLFFRRRRCCCCCCRCCWHHVCIHRTEKQKRKLTGHWFIIILVVSHTDFVINISLYFFSLVFFFFVVFCLFGSKVTEGFLPKERTKGENIATRWAEFISQRWKWIAGRSMKFASSMVELFARSVFLRILLFLFFHFWN